MAIRLWQADILTLSFEMALTGVAGQTYSLGARRASHATAESLGDAPGALRGGPHGGPAFLVYYSPAFLRQVCMRQVPKSMRCARSRSRGHHAECGEGAFGACARGAKLDGRVHGASWEGARCTLGGCTVQAGRVHSLSLCCLHAALPPRRGSRRLSTRPARAEAHPPLRDAGRCWVGTCDSAW